MTSIISADRFPRTFFLGVILLATGCASAPRSSIPASARSAPANSDEKVRVVFRVDDMGAGLAVNEACMKTLTDGIATSVEVLVPAPWFRDAARRLREHPEIDAGVHLDLTSEWEFYKWGPVSQGVPSLVDHRGNFYPMTSQRSDFPPNTGFLECGWKIEEVERELRAQIELARRELPRVTHMTAHMGTATSHPRLRELVDRLAEEYGLPIHLPGAERPPRFSGKDLSPGEKEKRLIEVLEGLEPGLYLFVEHPGLDTPEMRGMGHHGYRNVAADRAGVTHAFTSPRVKATLERLGIESVSYADLLGEAEKR